ncbi:SELM protein, partial [Polypterus senegalus]
MRWLALLCLTLASVRADPADNDTGDTGKSDGDKPEIARGKVIHTIQVLNPVHSSHNLQYDSTEQKEPQLVLYDKEDKIVKAVSIKDMKADEISALLDSFGFYKRSQKGEDVPQEFQHLPLRVPRDEL